MNFIIPGSRLPTIPIITVNRVHHSIGGLKNFITSSIVYEEKKKNLLSQNEIFQLIFMKTTQKIFSRILNLNPELFGKVLVLIAITLVPSARV